jgi:hypothetical protein
MSRSASDPGQPSTSARPIFVRFSQVSPLRREIVLLVLASLLSIGIHARFKVTGWGETDAARLARDAIGWHIRGYVTDDSGAYTQRTSTLYLQFEKGLLDHGLPVRDLPRFMNWFSVVLGTACSVVLYVLFRALTDPRKAAAATLVHALTPGFWLGNVYGMPTVPGLFFFVLGVLAFLYASRLPLLRSSRFAALVVSSWLCLFAAMGFKADLALSAGAFLAVALARPGRRMPLTLAAGGIVGGATAATIVYRRLLLSGPPGPGTVSFLKSWNEQFPFKAAALLTDSNNTTIVRCAGGLLFGVIVLALIHGLASGGALRRGALLAMLWGLPPIIVWGFQFDDSARHNVPGFPPLVLCATIFLFHVVGDEPRRAALLIAGVMVVSYFSNTWGNGSIVPQSNLIALSEKVEGMTADLHDRAREIAGDPSPKRLILYSSEDPYIQFEVLSLAKQPKLEMGDLWRLTDGDQVTDFFFSRDVRATRNIARQYKRDGYAILSLARY